MLSNGIPCLIYVHSQMLECCLRKGTTLHLLVALVSHALSTFSAHCWWERNKSCTHHWSSEPGHTSPMCVWGTTHILNNMGSRRQKKKDQSHPHRHTMTVVCLLCWQFSEYLHFWELLCIHIWKLEEERMMERKERCVMFILNPDWLLHSCSVWKGNPLSSSKVGSAK